MPFPMLSDAGGRVGSIYGIYDKEAGVNIHGRFLIDLEFVIRSLVVMTPEVGRNMVELIQQVKVFHHIREIGDLIPAGWVPGKPNLKPGPDLAGKVWKVWNPETKKQLLQKNWRAFPRLSENRQPGFFAMLSKKQKKEFYPFYNPSRTICSS